ncbi:MAG TPA: copper chaperone PCu(A)C [Xanthobacteraceae bacterium]|nr:copper chaperone PCu(A)C [Xanthobacteraceae bacterium]
MKFAFFLAAVLAFAASTASANNYKVGSLEIENPWTRATPKGAPVASGYLKITNKGTAADRLISGTVTAADHVEIHEMAMMSGMMKMRPVAGGLEIKPGETVELKPGSYHLMFMRLKHPLEKGQRVKGTLTFEKAGPVDVEFVVNAIGAKAPGEHMTHDSPMEMH